MEWMKQWKTNLSCQHLSQRHLVSQGNQTLQLWLTKRTPQLRFCKWIINLNTQLILQWWALNKILWLCQICWIKVFKLIKETINLTLMVKLRSLLIWANKELKPKESMAKKYITFSQARRGNQIWWNCIQMKENSTIKVKIKELRDLYWVWNSRKSED
jgi:hypothetical protein